MAVGRQRAGRPIAGLTCNMRERRNSTGSGATGRRRSACPVATGPFPQSTTRRVRARAFVRVLGQAARAAAAHVLTAASFVPSPAPAEQTLSGRGGFILTFVDLLSVVITRRLGDTRVGHATDFHSAHWSPRGARGKPVPTRTASKIIGQHVSAPRPCGSSSGSTLAKKLPIGLGSSFSPSCAGIVAVSASHPDHRQLLTQIVALPPRLRTSQGDAPAP